MTSSRRVERSVLWPFFNYTHDEDDHYTQWDFPWPILQFAQETTRIFRFSDLRPQILEKGWNGGYILWPVYWYVRQRMINIRSQPSASSSIEE
jgi:hypothetical protein